MALTSRSVFLYGYQITELNRSLDFKAANGGLELHATLTLGYYSLTGLLTEVVRAMREADPNNRYTATANRGVSGGLQNRVTISTNGNFLSLLFGTGSRAASSCGSLLGFYSTDRTGATSYEGNISSGTVFSPGLVGYEFTSPDRMTKITSGSVNISASGVTEFVTWGTSQFWQVRFKYINEAELSSWISLMTWLINKRPVEFTPEGANYSTFYEGYLESTPAESKGLGYEIKEMLPMVGMYDTGLMKFRVNGG